MISNHLLDNKAVNPVLEIKWKDYSLVQKNNKKIKYPIKRKTFSKPLRRWKVVHLR